MTKPFNIVVVTEDFHGADGDDITFRRYLNYVLRGVIRTAQDPTKPHGDWSAEVIRDRVADASCGFVVVVLDNHQDDAEGGDCFSLRPKCFAAIAAAQEHGKPYSVLMPFLRYRQACEGNIDAIAQIADAEQQRATAEAMTYRFTCGDADSMGCATVRVPLQVLTFTADAVVASLMATMSRHDDGDTTTTSTTETP